MYTGRTLKCTLHHANVTLGVHRPNVKSCQCTPSVTLICFAFSRCTLGITLPTCSTAQTQYPISEYPVHITLTLHLHSVHRVSHYHNAPLNAHYTSLCLDARSWWWNNRSNSDSPSTAVTYSLHSLLLSHRPLKIQRQSWWPNRGRFARNHDDSFPVFHRPFPQPYCFC